MNKQVLLDQGVITRQLVLTIYRHFPRDDAAQIARYMIAEIGETMADLHGRPDAAAAVYSAADALTLKLPVEDFRLYLNSLPNPAAARTPKPFRDLNWGGKIGHIIGKLLRFFTSGQFAIGYALGIWTGYLK